MSLSDTPAFLFTARHEAFRATVKRFADSFAAGYHARAMSLDFFWDLYRETGARGLLGLTVPAELGGTGASSIETGIAIEEIGRGDFNLGFALFGAFSANEILAVHGTDAARARWLAPALAGETVIGFALTELVAGSDSRNIETRATRVAGGWRIDGHKTSSGFAVCAGASIVFARTSDDPRAGITALLVPLDSSGVTRERIDSGGFRPNGRGKLGLNGVFVPDENVIGEVGRGFAIVTSAFDYTRAVIALLGIGAASRALEIAIAWAGTRETFGDVLSSRQGVTFPIAEHMTRLEAARLLAYHVLARRDAGLPHAKESAMAKWFGVQAAVEAVHESILLHGHRAYSEELPLMQLHRDLMGLELAEGTAQIQKMIISREIFGRGSGGRAQEPHAHHR